MRSVNTVSELQHRAYTAYMICMRTIPRACPRNKPAAYTWMPLNTRMELNAYTKQRVSVFFRTKTLRITDNNSRPGIRRIFSLSTHWPFSRTKSSIPAAYGAAPHRTALQSQFWTAFIEKISPVKGTPFNDPACNACRRVPDMKRDETRFWNITAFLRRR
jgi:hypothetical protein